MRPLRDPLHAVWLGLVLLVGACSEPSPVEEDPIRAHPVDWSNPAKPDWHGARVVRDGTGFCTGCHGSHLRGAIGVPGCYDCHNGPGGHLDSWSSPPAPFHGTTVVEDGPEGCKTCHGEDLSGGWSGVSCDDCHNGAGGHSEFWKTPPAPFHGTPVQYEGPSGCTTCHGSDYRGGWSGVSCYTCHAGGPSGHPEGWMDTRAHTFHGDRVAADGDEDCRRCHGNDLLGGTSGISCGDCHF